IRNLKARYDLGLGAFFPGAAAIFDYEWLRARGFDETSITEDWELSLRCYAEGDFRIVVREDIWVSAAVPKNLGWFVRQQFLAVAWGWPLYRASKFEGYNLRQLVAVLAYGFAVAYVLAPSGALAFFSGLVRDSRFWRVTRRRG